MNINGVQIQVQTSDLASGRLVYGTETERWYLVGHKDRDYRHGIPVETFESQSEEESRAQYLDLHLV